MLRGRTHEVQVIGIGHQKSQGVKSGVVIDLNRAEHAIRLAVDAAERMAGLTVDSLIVNLTAGRLKSETYSATINLGGHEADAADIKRVLAAGAKQALKAEREVVHSLPVGFSLDGERGVRDPRGMVGDTLGVDMHVLDRRRRAAAQSRALHQPLRIFPSSAWWRRPMPAALPRWSTTNSKWARPASTWAAARPRSRYSPTASSSTAMPFRSAAATSRWIWPRAFRRGSTMPSG